MENLPVITKLKKNRTAQKSTDSLLHSCSDHNKQITDKITVKLEEQIPSMKTNLLEKIKNIRKTLKCKNKVKVTLEKSRAKKPSYKNGFAIFIERDNIEEESQLFSNILTWLKDKYGSISSVKIDHCSLWINDSGSKLSEDELAKCETSIVIAKPYSKEDMNYSFNSTTPDETDEWIKKAALHNAIAYEYSDSGSDSSKDGTRPKSAKEKNTQNMFSDHQSSHSTGSDIKDWSTTKILPTLLEETNAEKEKYKIKKNKIKDKYKTKKKQLESEFNKIKDKYKSKKKQSESEFNKKIEKFDDEKKQFENEKKQFENDIKKEYKQFEDEKKQFEDYIKKEYKQFEDYIKNEYKQFEDEKKQFEDEKKQFKDDIKKKYKNKKILFKEKLNKKFENNEGECKKTI